MKRILFSLGMIAFVGSVVVGSTGAFFSDTESSINNIFTAGSIDLKIDHSLSTYNGNAVQNDLVVVSDPSTTFTGADGAGNAVALSFVHPAWTAPVPGATWIWATNPVSNPSIDQTNTFTRTFTWNGPVTSASMKFAADNFYNVKLNGNLVGDNQLLLTANFQSDHQTDVTAYIVQGLNTITFVAKNFGINGSSPADNPAGIIFRLDVHGSLLFPTPIDLTGQPIWNFNDVKPADQGRDVLSTHVGTNDAWTCMQVGNVRNNENNVIEPETTAGDPGGGPIGNGELGQYMQLFLWHDTNGNGVFNPPGETQLGSGVYPSIFTSGFGSTTIALHDSGTGNGALVASSTEYIGAAWCVGTVSANPTTGAISCDGSTVSNQAQTDSTLVDLGFYAMQQRNNPNFLCSSLNPI